MLDSNRVERLTDRVVELTSLSADKSWGAIKKRIRAVIAGDNVGTDVRERAFTAIRQSMTRRSARKRSAAATKRSAQQRAS